MIQGSSGRKRKTRGVHDPRTQKQTHYAVVGTSYTHNMLSQSLPIPEEQPFDTTFSAASFFYCHTDVFIVTLVGVSKCYYLLLGSFEQKKKINLEDVR